LKPIFYFAVPEAVPEIVEAPAVPVEEPENTIGFGYVPTPLGALPEVTDPVQAAPFTPLRVKVATFAPLVRVTGVLRRADSGEAGSKLPETEPSQTCGTAVAEGP